MVPVVERSIEPFTELIERAVGDAVEAGASESQLALLKEAATAGEVTVEQMREAARTVVQCMKDAGLEAEYLETSNAGVTLPSYQVRVGTGGDDSRHALGEACETREYNAISYVYQVQPSSVALSDAHYQQFVPVVRECLQDAGYTVDPAARWVEVESQLQQALIESDGTVNCFEVVIEADRLSGGS